MALTLLLSVVMNGCSEMSKATKAIVEQADSAYGAGHFTRAEQLYQEALAMRKGMGRIEGQLGLIALWRNDLASAESYLKAAREDGPWWTRHWPVTAQIDSRLALACIRAGRVHEAAAILREAAGPLPWGPFHQLQVSADQLALFDDNTFYNIEGPDEIVVPFISTDPLPVVQVSVNGSAPVNFFIDTGGEGITLNRAFAEAVGATIIGEYAGEYAGGKTGMTGYGKIDELRLNNLVISNIPISTLDLEATSQRVFAGMPVAGIIGTGFLSRFLATIDYPNQRLLLRSRGETAEEIDRRLALDGKAHIFPMWLVETHLIFAEGSFNGREPEMLMIDTGLAGAAFLTSKAHYRAAGVAMDWSKMVTGAGGGGEVKGITVSIDELTLGSGDNRLSKRGLTGVAMERDNSLFNGSIGFAVGGLISHQFFRDHAVSFDFCHMRLIVQ